MIIQTKCSATHRWFDRTQCPESRVEKEVEALKKIYVHNEFRVVEGDTKLPGPIYDEKTEAEIGNIVSGIKWLKKQRRDQHFSNKTMHVMQGKFKQQRG